MKLTRSINEIDKEKYFFVKYFLKSSVSLYDAAFALSVGQSVGNPNVRNSWETEELFENHACKIIGNEKQLKSKKSGKVLIAFPLANINLKEDGLSQLFCFIMGGNLDIDSIKKCHVLDIEFPESVERKYFLGPKYGLKGVREFLGIFDKPIFGGIVKPKVGVDPETLLKMVKEMVEGGISFIKEDEIMSDPPCCPLEVRVPLIMNYLKDKKVIYAVCINADSPYLLERAKKVYELGGNGIHINFWSGIGVYKAIRELELPLFIHFQKSGDKILTDKSHRFHIDWNVICKIAGLSGVDFIHAGMWGGYSNDDELELKSTLDILHKYGTIPALSCGLHPGLVQAIIKRFGIDVLLNCGGAIHGHPGNTKNGVLAMRQAIDGNHGPEYFQAIEKWGLVK